MQSTKRRRQGLEKRALDAIAERLGNTGASRLPHIYIAARWSAGAMAVQVAFRRCIPLQALLRCAYPFDHVARQMEHGK